MVGLKFYNTGLSNHTLAKFSLFCNISVRYNHAMLLSWSVEISFPSGDNMQAYVADPSRGKRDNCSFLASQRVLDLTLHTWCFGNHKSNAFVLNALLANSNLTVLMNLLLWIGHYSQYLHFERLIIVCCKDWLPFRYKFMSIFTRSLIIYVLVIK